MADVTVRAMTEPEFEAWQLALAHAYADDQVAAGNWPAGEALDRALRGNAELLPGGLATPRMLLLIGVLGEGTAIGRLWIGLDHPRGAPGCAFLYDIEVDEAYRGAGHGRALLAAGESVARSHGATALELNVFGDNTRAMRLYAGAGYRVVTQQMRKDLS